MSGDFSEKLEADCSQRMVFSKSSLASPGCRLARLQVAVQLGDAAIADEPVLSPVTVRADLGR